jgi:hypothetical protein
VFAALGPIGIAPALAAPTDDLGFAMTPPVGGVVQATARASLDLRRMSLTSLTATSSPWRDPILDVMLGNPPRTTLLHKLAFATPLLFTGGGFPVGVLRSTAYYVPLGQASATVTSTPGGTESAVCNTPGRGYGFGSLNTGPGAWSFYFSCRSERAGWCMWTFEAAARPVKLVDGQTYTLNGLAKVECGYLGHPGPDLPFIYPPI